MKPQHRFKRKLAHLSGKVKIKDIHTWGPRVTAFSGYAMPKAKVNFEGKNQSRDAPSCMHLVAFSFLLITGALDPSELETHTVCAKFLMPSGSWFAGTQLKDTQRLPGRIQGTRSPFPGSAGTGETSPIWERVHLST